MFGGFGWPELLVAAPLLCLGTVAVAVAAIVWAIRRNPDK
jgi:hypothetical protein